MVESLIQKMVPTPLTAPPQWKFYNPVHVTLGRGCRIDLLKQVQGQRLLVVTSQRGRQQLLDDSILSALVTQCSLHWVDTIIENPALLDLQEYIHHLADIPFDAVIGFGGGSALDAAKVLHLGLNSESRPYSLEQLIANPELHPISTKKPLYVLPTTAGTGSEVTPFATLWNHAEKKKLSLTSSAIFPTAAWVDAELTDSLPLEATITTGLDAINQATESIWNKSANPITLAYATRALQLGFSALPALAKGQDTKLLRNQMAEASLLAGLAISHTRTAICHSISYPLTIYFGIPHGLACAFTMPAALRYNLEADDGRFEQLSVQLLGSASTIDLLKQFEKINTQLNVREKIKQRIPNLDDLLALESQMFTAGRINNNLREINDISQLLIEAWG